ncbi:unnamed protein product, partial [Prorocentrum cordatum]
TSLQDSFDDSRAELLEHVIPTAKTPNASLQGLAGRVKSTCSPIVARVERRLDGVGAARQGRSKQLLFLQEEVNNLEQKLAIVRDTPNELPMRDERGLLGDPTEKRFAVKSKGSWQFA